MANSVAPLYLQPQHQWLLAIEAGLATSGVAVAACMRNAHMYGVLVMAHPHPTLVHHGNGKLMPVDASSELWGLAWHRRMPSSSPKPTAKVFRAF